MRGGSRFDAAYDRQIVQDLIDLAPPGLDELFAMLSVIDALEGPELVVVDTAPTGHALRLLELPTTASAWVRELLADPSRTRFIAVTRPAELPRVETSRLISALARLEVPLGGVVVNAITPLGCPRCVRASKVEAKQVARLTRSLRGESRAVILAPAVAPPPRGAPALSDWSQTWRRERT